MQELGRFPYFIWPPAPPQSGQTVCGNLPDRADVTGRHFHLVHLLIFFPNSRGIRERGSSIFAMVRQVRSDPR